MAMRLMFIDDKKCGIALRKSGQFVRVMSGDDECIDREMFDFDEADWTAFKAEGDRLFAEMAKAQQPTQDA